LENSIYVLTKKLGDNIDLIKTVGNLVGIKVVKPTYDSTDLLLQVTESNEGSIEDWDKSKIVTVLKTEINIPKESSEKIADLVEKRVLSSGVKRITVNLIRELVNSELFSNGFNKKLEKHETVGMSFFDLDKLILNKSIENSNVSNNNPEAINLSIAENMLKQYALKKVFSKPVSTAHLKGEIHLHDLGYPVRNYCSSHSIEYIKKYGLNGLVNLTTISAPAKHASTLTGHLNTFLSSIQAYYAGALGVAYTNISYAPYLVGMSYKQIKQEAQYLIFSLSQNAFSRANQVLFINLNVHLGIPNELKDTPAIGPGGIYKGVYKDYEKEAKLFTKALLEVWKEGDKNGQPFPFPICNLHIDKNSFEKDIELLKLACEATSENGCVYFIFDRDAVVLSACCRLRTTLKDFSIFKHPESIRFSFPRYESVIIKENDIVKIVNFEKLFNMIDSEIQNKEDFEIKHIKNIHVWDDGKWVNMLKVMRHKIGKKTLRTIQTSTGNCITATNDHPIPCDVKYGKFTCTHCNSTEFTNSGSTKRGDSILQCKKCKKYKVVPFSKPKLELTESIKIPKNSFLNRTGQPIAKNKYIPLIKMKNNEFITKGIAYLLGVYIGNGSIVGSSIHISSSIENVNMITRFFNDDKIKYSVYKDRNSKTVAIHNIKLVNFIKDKMMNGRAVMKQLPIDIMQWEENLVQSLISGVIDSDGCIHRKSVEILNSSKTALSQIQILLNEYGFYSSLSYSNQKPINKYYNGHNIIQRNAYFILRIPITKSLKKWLGYSSKIEKTENVSTYMYNKKKQKNGCFTTKNVKTFSENEEFVYDITTSSGTLSLNGIQVHNCGFQNVTINLPQASYRANGDLDKTIKEILNTMKIAMKAHLEKKKFVEKLMSKPNLPLWQVGKPAEDGKPYVDLEEATYIIGIIGLNECVRRITGKELHESEEAYKTGLKIISAMYLKTKEFKKETGLTVSLEESPAESAGLRLAKIDLKRFPESKDFIKGDKRTGQVFYTNSVHLNPDADVDILERIEKQAKFNPLIESGAITHVFLGEQKPDPVAIFSLVKKTWENTQSAQLVISPEFTICNDCHKMSRGYNKENAICPFCKSKNVYGMSRVVGYYSKIENWNDSKQAEFKARQEGNYKV